MIKINLEICEFTGDYKFLSNFYMYPLEYNNLIYPALENAFQAQKTEDLAIQEKFTHLTPARAKQKGRTLDIDPYQWDLRKNILMGDLLRIKFKTDPLREMLKRTGSRKLVEGNWWGDEYWGRCNGIGKNMLGVLLMLVREEIRMEDDV